MLHYPIGFLTLAFILEIYRLRRPSRELHRITGLVIGLSLFSGLLSATLGLLRAGSGGYDPESLGLHRAFGLSIPVLTLLTWVAHIRLGRDENNRCARTGYRALLGAALTVLVVGGHLGGNLTHGSRYLVQNAPQFVKTLLDEETPDASGDVSAVDEKQRYFSETIRPILNAKCLACHGPEKQKGAYRLDKPDSLIKGGESGLAAIQPGDPMRSELVRRILLPTGHDEAMPPEGKAHLSAEEILLLARWIQDGAAIGEAESLQAQTEASRGTPPAARPGSQSAGTAGD